ncbi:MAG: hypothetical protein IJY17_05355 [Alphaproteobacteria bacterium]|nr:hypothetical protein [Alphaproteobacteria bacterium]
MIFKTEEELKIALRTAAQTEMLLSQDGSVPAFVLPEDIATMRYVLDTLMSQIKDLRTRRIIWLRSQGLCWKTVAKEVGLTESQAKRVFRLSMSLMIAKRL